MDDQLWSSDFQSFGIGSIEYKNQWPFFVKFLVVPSKVGFLGKTSFMGQSCRKPIGHSSTRSSSALIIRALCSECALMAHHLHNPILVKREVKLFGSGHTEHKGELVWSPNNTLTKRETQKPQLDSREIHVRKRCLCNWPNMSIV